MEPLTRAFAELQHAAAHLGDQFNQLGCQLQAMINHQDPAGCRTSHLPHRVSFASAFASLTNAAPKGSGLKLPFGGQAKSSKQQNGDAGKGKGNGQGRAPEERVLISEVEVVGVDGELKRIVQDSLRQIKPNFAYTLQEVENDLRRVFSTGWFSAVIPDAEDTRDGVKLIIKVTANPELKGITTKGAKVLPTKIIQDAFKKLHGRTINYVKFGKAIEKLDNWYKRRGVLGQVVDFTVDNGQVQLSIGEAEVNSVNLQFIDPKTGGVKEQGATKPEVITRYLTIAPGKVYSLRQAKQDIDSIYSTGLFEDVNIIPKEADDSTEQNPRVDLTINLAERKTGGLGAGTGISANAHGEGAMPGFVGNFTYSQRNFRGLNQRLSALVELGQADTLVRVQFADPWIMGDPYRTSRSLSFMNNKHSGAAIHARVNEPGEEETSGGAGNVVLSRLVAGLEMRRPLASNWTGTAGLNWQRTKCMDEKGQPLQQDCYGAPLTFSGADSDVMMLGLITANYSERDGSQMGVTLEQALPVKRDWLNFNRLRLRLDQPVQMGPLQLTFRGKAGAIYGDLPPYEAFPLGGTNSVRGYAEGGVGSGRYFVEGSTELRMLLAKPVYGTLFVDYGSDLDSGETVLGDPAGARGKPGSGYGYGAGIRVDSPLGPIRLEYAWNDLRKGRFHIALGYE